MVFYRNSSYRKLRKVLESHGFVVNQGGNHAKAFCNEHQATIIFPRSRKISPGVMKNIVASLTGRCGMDESDLTAKLK